MRKKSMMKKMVSVATAAAMAATMLSGCGSSGEKSASGSDAGGLTEVKVASPTALASLDLCWLYAADALGFLAEEGISLSMIECTDGSDPKLLAAGEADFAGFSPSVGLTAVQSGVTNVKGICNTVAYNMFGIAVNKDSEIKDWADFTGKNIGFVSEAGAVLYNPILQAAGVDTSTVTYTNYGTAEYEALASGQVPAMGTWLSEYYMCQGMGYEWEYFSGDDVLPQMANSLWVNTEFAEKNPDLVKGMVRAVEKSMYACYYAPEVVADLVLVRYPSIEITWDGAVGAVEGNVAGMFGIDKADQEANVSKNEIGLYDMDVVNQTVQNLKDGGALTEDMDFASYYTNDYVTTGIDFAAVEEVCNAYEFSSDAYKEAH